MSTVPVLRLRRGRGERLRAGHPWVYRGEVLEEPSAAVPGGIVDVLDQAGRFLGRGYYNPVSQICCRLLTRAREEIGVSFFARRLSEAAALRRRFAPDREAIRLVYSEADSLPGLIVDRYGDCLVAQFLTLGMDVRREEIVSLLAAEFMPRAILERSEAGVRRHEGLGPRAGACYGEVPDEVVVADESLRFLVDLAGGQKTGHFLDQRDNRLAAAAYAAGRRVLDCFCHTGMFGVAAACRGAAQVIGVDIDADALDLAGRNAALNGVSSVFGVKQANAFDFLRAAVEEGDRYEMIILDPPAFTKSKLRLEQALRGYKEINLRAMRLLGPGGILVTCSCSHHVNQALFEEMLMSAAADANRRVRLLERRGQAPDHPVLLGVPETEYLKCLILEIL
ncbi:MAG: class I SAM-dependent rRNA methyltransferase [Patescibacteria group bacterium]